MKNSRSSINPDRTRRQQITGLLSVFIFLTIFCSCGNIRGLQYVQGEFDTTRLSKIQYKEPQIQKGDLLSIRVFSDDRDATAAVTNPSGVNFSQMTTNPGANNNNTTSPVVSAPTYLVDHSGNIQLYKLGSIHAEGMTKKQLGDTLAGLYESQGLLKNPYAEVRFVNYKITLVGEVSKPGVYTIPTERVNVFEAVGLAGDITVFGRRDNVLVVRETNGVREFGRLDLSKPDVFQSPYFYLQQNDMVFVDVRKNKSAMNDQVTVRNITIATSILSTIAIFLNVFRR